MNQDKSNITTSQKPKSHVLFSAKRRELLFWLNKIEYTGFPIHKIPTRFGYIITVNAAGNISEGIPMWFNRKGLTYIRTDLLQTGW
jgi:hypothetical protein